MMSKPIDTPANVIDDPTQKVSYANIAQIKVTPEEIIFHFGLRKEFDPDEAVGVAKIYVSVPHAKRIANILVRSLQRYEQLFGEIKVEVEDRLTAEGRKEFGE